MKRQLRCLLGLFLILPTLTACGSFDISFGRESGPQAAATTAATTTATVTEAKAIADAASATVMFAPSTATPLPNQPSSEYVIVERLRFRPGATRLAVEGTAAQGVSPRYVLGAQTGQTAQISLTSTNNAANYAVTGPNGQPLKRLENEARAGEFEIPTTGDYLISIGAADDDIVYVLTVEIPPVAAQPTASPPAEASAERIQFEAGATAATVEGTANENASPRYVFWALADQTATIRFTATNDAANYALTGPGGQIIERMDSEAPSGEFELAATGDYVIVIGTPVDGAQYTLTLEIE